jgi:hypothetical protein
MSGHERARFSAPQGSHNPQSFSAATATRPKVLARAVLLARAVSVDYSREPGVGFGHCRSRESVAELVNRGVL